MVYIFTAEIEATLDAQGETAGGGAIVRIPHRGVVAADVMVRRRFASERDNASVHLDRDEFYQVLDGGGMLMTGGTLIDPEDRAAGIRGGEERQIDPGGFVSARAAGDAIFQSLPKAATTRQEDSIARSSVEAIRHFDPMVIWGTWPGDEPIDELLAQLA